MAISMSVCLCMHVCDIEISIRAIARVTLIPIDLEWGIIEVLWMYSVDVYGRIVLLTNS